MTTSFPGIFAGKMAFCSTQPGLPAYYLTTCRQSNGQHGWSYSPGLNALTLGQTEKFLLYLYPDGYYRLQSGDLRWLSYNANAGNIEYGDDPAQAAAFVLQGTPFASSWLLHTDTGDQPIYYLCLNNLKTPNLLTTTNIDGSYSSLTPTVVTASLADIRQQKQAKNADFSHAVLLGQDLSQGIDFTGANFMAAQLAGVNFTSAILDQTNFSQTDIRGLNWGSPASAIGINLAGVNASGCILGGQQNALNCSNAILATGNFSGANLAKLNLNGAQLGSANLMGANLSSADLTQANLDKVVAIKCSFANATLTDASAQMGIFIQAVFDNATLTRVRMGASTFLFTLAPSFVGELDSAKFPQPDLITAFQKNGIALSPTAAVEVLLPKLSWFLDDPAGPYKLFLNETGIEVFNANPALTPAVLQGASLVGVQASGASLSGADLRGVSWYAAPATLDHADLQDAALSGAVLISMNFTQANLSGADFSGSLLTQAQFTGCVAGPGGSQRAISFENAHLEGADFSKATFAGALLTNAVVALPGGVPLLFLPLSDQQYLTNDSIGQLASAFKQAGFDLGTNPSLSDASSWIIDNSQCTDPQAPKQYVVQQGAGNLQVFAAGVYLFPLSKQMAVYLNQPTASTVLASAFTKQNYPLFVGAPITTQKSWIIAPDTDATYLKPYRFAEMSVQLESTRLTVYGTAPVLIDKLPQYPSGVGFSATQNLESALNATSLGPSGVPFAWVSQGLIDDEAFYLPPGS